MKKVVVRERAREGLNVLGNKNFEGRGMRWGFRKKLVMVMVIVMPTITSELKEGEDLTDIGTSYIILIYITR